MKNSIELTLLNTLKRHPQTPLVVAYSGGVDSQVLLHALAHLVHSKKIFNTITVCHVNHGLSENAATWQEFAQQQCLQHQLPIRVCAVNVKSTPQKSLEALAREARYLALHQVFSQQSIILTGHHSDDQAETFLLALKRGSGLKGLSAMAQESEFGKDILVRPLLHCSREQIVHYANANQLTWIEDESNQDISFDRNFFRQQIIPQLVQRWPSIVSTINRSSEHCREGQQLLDELAAEDLNICQHDVAQLAIEPLLTLSRHRFNNLIRFYLSQQRCLMPSTQQLRQLHQQLFADDDKSPVVKVGDHYFRRYQHSLYLTKSFKALDDWQAEITFNQSDSVSQNKLALPDQLGYISWQENSDEMISLKWLSNLKTHFIAKPHAQQRVILRFSHENPTCLPDYRHRSRSVKKILQELNIPPWQRKRIPFLYYDNVLVAAIGYFVCQDFAVKKTT